MHLVLTLFALAGLAVYVTKTIGGIYALDLVGIGGSIFFLAFLPQFVNITYPQGPQYLVLGAIFVALDTGVMLAYAGAGSQAVRWLSRRSLKALNRGCAIGMWLLAATLAVWRRPT